MTEAEVSGGRDAAVEHLRLSRNSDAVLKMRVVQTRAYCPRAPLLAFEGDDDKLVYAQWLRRIRPELTYEPFPCSGKTGVLALRAIAKRDLSGVGQGIYYFVDRDFDDLRGQPEGDDIFLTDCYSVENYLVERGVVDQILTSELHCHGRPDIREEITAVFEARYAEFLEVTSEINRRIFVARRSKTVLAKHLPDSVSAIAKIDLLSGKPSDIAAADIAPFAKEVDAKVERSLVLEFAELDRQTRYRGKFAYMFLQKWLEHLVQEYASANQTLFRDIKRTARARSSEFTLGGFASKSRIPEHLPAFVARIS